MHIENTMDYIRRKILEARHEMETQINNDLLQGQIVYRIQLSSGKMDTRIWMRIGDAKQALKYTYGKGTLRRYHLVPIIDPAPSQEP